MPVNLVPLKRSCHKYMHVEYEVSNSYQSKDIVNVKSSLRTIKRTNGLTDGRTDGRVKNYMSPIYRCVISIDAGA